MSVRVTVVCDSAKHARGKVAKVAEFGVTADKVILLMDRDQLDEKVADIKERLANTPVRKKDGVPTISMTENDHLWFTTGKAPVVCRLCRRRLRPSAALDAAIRWIAESEPKTVSSHVTFDKLLGMLSN
jgi:hypothetical protein